MYSFLCLLLNVRRLGWSVELANKLIMYNFLVSSIVSVGSDQSIMLKKKKLLVVGTCLVGYDIKTLE